MYERARQSFNRSMRLLWVLVFVALGFLFQCNNNNAPSGNGGNGGNVTVDADGDGLIDISTAEMLNNMRYDLAGTSYKTSATDAGDSSGCPIGGCNGYELMANIDLLPMLDANGNGQIDKTTVTVASQMHTVIDVGPRKDTSWVPVGNNANRFTGTFEGNGNTIANLWVNVSSSSGSAYAGLFGATGGTVEIRNVGVISGGVFSSSSSGSYSGGLVGRSFSSLTITNSYFSGSGGVSSSSSSSSSGSFSYSGGLVGRSSSLTITNSYFSGSGGVSSSSSSSSGSFSSGSYSGGLVGSSDATFTITNSYFSGEGGVSSSSSSSSSSSTSDSYSGGLVGRSSSLTITNSYFSGSGGVSSSSSSSGSGSFSFSFSGGLVGRFSSSVLLTIRNSYFSGSGGVSSSSSSDSYSGGLVGFSSNTPVIMNSYWNADAPQSTDGSPQSPKRAQGDATADPMGAVGLTLAELKATSGSTYPNLLGDAWDLGTDQQNPAVKRCILDMAGTSCASPAMYGALLNGQR